MRRVGKIWRGLLTWQAVLLLIPGIAASQVSGSIEQLDQLLEELDPPSARELLEHIGPVPTLNELLVPLPDDFVPISKRPATGELQLRLAELKTQRDQESDPEAATDLAWELFELSEEEWGADHTRTIRAQWRARQLETLASLEEEDRELLEQLSGQLGRGVIAYREGRLDEALELTVELVCVEYELMGRAGSVAAPLGTIAAILYARGDYPRGDLAGRAALQQAFEEEGIQSAKVATALNNIASLSTIMRRLDVARLVHTHSLAIRRELFGDRGGEFAQALLQLAGMFRLNDEPESASRAVDRAIAILEESGDMPDRLGILLNERGVLEWMRGEDDLARASLQRSIGILRSVYEGDNMVVSDALGTLSDLERNRGNFDLALDLAHEAHQMSMRLHAPGNPLLGIPLHRLANSLEVMGDFAGAEQAYRDAFACKNTSPDEYVEGRTMILVSLSQLLFEKGDLVDAREVSEIATVEQRAQLGGTRLFAGALRKQARRRAIAGDVEGAQRDLDEALAISIELFELGHPRLSGLNLDRADLLLDQGELDAAAELIGAALRNTQGLPGAAREIQADGNQLAGKLAGLQGRHEEAITFAEVALAMRREMLSSPNSKLVDSLFLLGENAEAHGDSSAAIAAYSEALEQASALRTRIAGDERDRAVFAGRMSIGKIARTLALNHIRLEEPELAFEAAEEGRERALLDLVQRSGTDLIALARRANQSGAERLEEQLQSCRQAEQRLRYVEQKLRTAGAERSATLASVELVEKELQEAQQTLASFEGGLESILREVWPSAEPLPAKTVSEALGPKEVLLHYTFDKNGVGLTAVRGGPDGGWHAESLALGAAAVEELEEQMRLWLTALRTGRDVDPDLRIAVSKRLMPESIWRILADSERVILIPDGVLNELPFECLMTPDGDWLERGPHLVYSPSATLFARERVAPRKRPGGTPRALVLGNPTFAPAEVQVAMNTAPTNGSVTRDLLRSRFGGRLAPLPGSEIEAERIAQTLGAADWSVETLIGPAAVSDALQSSAPGATVLHLATHAFAAQVERPYDSALALAWPEESASARNAFLSLDDLIRHWGGVLKGCDLVVLSACDTQVGVVLGESRVALSWGFFYAGADSVLVSLWKVDDRATALLMDRFYSNYVGSFDVARRAGTVLFPAGQAMDEAAALQEAKGWLSVSTPEENKQRLTELGFKLDEDGKTSLATRGQFPRPSTGPSSRPILDAFDFRPARFGAAFVLYGQPD